MRVEIGAPDPYELPCDCGEGILVRRVTRHGPARLFFGCSEYPRCKRATSLRARDMRVLTDIIGERPENF